MNVDPWERVEELYNAVLEREPADRPGFLAEATGGDEGLRREVESLLKYDSRAAGFIETSACFHGMQNRQGLRRKLESGRRHPVPDAGCIGL